MVCDNFISLRCKTTKTMEKKSNTKVKVSSAPKKTISITDSKSVVAPKKLNKYGEWLRSMEGLQGYIIIKDQRAI